MLSLFCIAALQTATATAPAGPDDIVLEYERSSNSSQLWDADRALLARYAAQAETVVVGEVVAVRPDTASFGLAEIATILIEERFRGDAVGVTEFRAPLGTDDDRKKSTIIQGYRLLLFLDRSDNVIDGEAMFFVEGGHIWRNRSADVFFRPSADRAWDSLVDPQEDYVTLSLDEVRTAASQRRKRRHWRRRR